MSKHLSLAVACCCLLFATPSCRREIPAYHPLRTDETLNALAGANLFAGPTSDFSVLTGCVTTVPNDLPFSWVTGLVMDAAGNIYSCEPSANLIKKTSPDGATIVFAGDGTPGLKNGSRLQAQFNYPNGIALDKNGNLYVADRDNNCIRRIDLVGNVSVYAGNGTAGYKNGGGDTAMFNGPSGIAIDTTGKIYIADKYNSRIRVISTSRQVSLYAGDGLAGFKEGSGGTVEFNYPDDVAVTPGGILYVADGSNHRIRRLVAGVSFPFVGSGNKGSADGTGTAASFFFPIGVTVDGNGNVFIADYYNYRVRKATPSGVVTTIAGDHKGFANGNGSGALFYGPIDAIVDPTGVLYVSDFNNFKIRRISIQPAVATLAGTGGSSYVNGSKDSAQLHSPYGITSDANGNIYTLDNDARVRKISPVGQVSLLAGSGQWGYAEGIGEAASFSTGNTNLLADAGGNIYVADGNNQRIRKITPDGDVSTYAGNGVAGSDTGAITGSVINTVSALAFDAQGNMLASEWFPGDIRKITPGGRISTLATIPTPAGTAAPLPAFMATDAASNAYVVCPNQSTVWKVTPAGTVSIFANAQSMGTWTPSGIDIDKANGKIYLADRRNNRMLIFSSEGELVEVVGDIFNTSQAFLDGPESVARLAFPEAMVLSGTKLYFADQGNSRIRMFSRR